MTLSLCLVCRYLVSKVTLHTVSLAGPRKGDRSKTRSCAVKGYGLESGTTSRKAVVRSPAPGCRCIPPACRKHITKILSVLTRRLRLRRYTRLGAGGAPVSVTASCLLNTRYMNNVSDDFK